MVNDLLPLIPENRIEKTIYFDLGNPDWIPIWNPLKMIPGQDESRTADNVVGTIKSVVQGWGDRLEYILSNCLKAALHLDNPCFLDVWNLLRIKSAESEKLQRQALQTIENITLRQFLETDARKYREDETTASRHKLGKLFGPDNTALMLSQSESLFNIRSVMDEGRILLVNLSTIGQEARGILGGFMLSLAHLTALSRVDTPPNERKECHVYCDEAYQFMTDAIEELTSQTRKFAVYLTLLHQQLSQFGTKKIDALSSVGSTIIFRVDSKDARYLTKDLMGKVDANALSSLKDWEAIARIGSEVVKVWTQPPPAIPTNNPRDRVIAESRRRYYRPANVIRALVQKRNGMHVASARPFNSSMAQESNGPVEQFHYQEFQP